MNIQEGCALIRKWFYTAVTNKTFWTTVTLVISWFIFCFVFLSIIVNYAYKVGIKQNIENELIYECTTSARYYRYNAEECDNIMKQVRAR